MSPVSGPRGTFAISRTAPTKEAGPRLVVRLGDVEELRKEQNSLVPQPRRSNPVTPRQRGDGGPGAAEGPALKEELLVSSEAR